MNIKSLYGTFLMGVMRTAGRDAAKKLDTFLRYRKQLDLKNPRSLREKIIYLENHGMEPMAAMCTDKWAVREFVAGRGYGDTLVPVYGGAYSRVEEIPFESFPEKYVLKATHGCKMNYFCTDQQSFDVDACQKVLRSWLETTYGRYSGEWHYLEISHRIYCEMYLDDADKMVDYKIHCMNGRPEFILVCGSRSVSSFGNRISRQIYDLNWNPMAGLLEEPGEPIPKPACFDRMIRMATDLSGDFRFVRVDLYEIRGKLYFGELTFTPTGGVFSHYSDAFLNEMGSRLAIEM